MNASFESSRFVQVLFNPLKPPFQVKLPGDGTAMDQPFDLPLVPLSQCYWLNNLANVTRKLLGRSIAVTLVLDTELHIWRAAVLPSQICRPDGSAWRIDPEEYAGLPKELRIAGSYQSAAVESESEIEGLVPPYDGVHFLDLLFKGQRQMFYFVRSEGRVGMASSEWLLLDDWRDMLERSKDRLTLG